MRKGPIIHHDVTSNYSSRIAAHFLHIRHRKQLPLLRDHPALQAISRSPFPFGFPLENPLHQTSNEEVLLTQTTNAPQPSIPSTSDPCVMQQIGAMTKSLLTSQRGGKWYNLPRLHSYIGDDCRLPYQVSASSQGSLLQETDGCLGLIISFSISFYLLSVISL